MAQHVFAKPHFPLFCLQPTTFLRKPTVQFNLEPTVYSPKPWDLNGKLDEPEIPAPPPPPPLNFRRQKCYSVRKNIHSFERLPSSSQKMAFVHPIAVPSSPERNPLRNYQALPTIVSKISPCTKSPPNGVKSLGSILIANAPHNVVLRKVKITQNLGLGNLFIYHSILPFVVLEAIGCLEDTTYNSSTRFGLSP